MPEAELKARVRVPEDVTRRLEARGAGRAEVYQDTYYDDQARTLAARDAELRVRTVHGAGGTRSLLTFKDATVDEASGSKPEHGTRVEGVEALHETLRRLGYIPVIAFEKRCRNYDIRARGREMLATLVRVPEIDGTFIEVETLVEDGAAVEDALKDVSDVLAELGVGEGDMTSELYTDAVAGI
ncbi:class IV adenylate cyclase [Streptomyces iconiensis]|uniref:Class IV adenylate cyclase n=1 Tax=Streptomyces iconiensis TaxID=1384038 RepID=A0ABT6ZY00_9ACTN|nr:class IV adenylate cyclase [Streptomyces iconiensis]MDJ1133935.1 class IV adenylate cyclase [Streptomyces iconiensis]